MALTTGCSSGDSGVTADSSESEVPVVDSAEQTSDTSSAVSETENDFSTEENNSGLSEKGSGYEGRESTGDFNYGEALQKSLLFYELQRSGDLDENTIRTNWRGDSGLNDGSDAGIDLTGGLYDAGDNVKFNLPMAYTATLLCWSVYQDREAYEESKQLEYALGDIKWICDYLIKCHTAENEYYYQVGDGNADHAWWGSAEVMQMDRPCYKVDKDNPGSAVVGEAAAALAACSVVFADTDKEYSEKCLTHAKQLYNFAESTKSDAGYTAANGFYNSWSGFYDELTWAADWLYIATEDKSWLDKAKEYEAQCSGNPQWMLCWDDKYIGAVCLLANLTGEDAYKGKLEESLDWWCDGITYTPKGLAWLDTWGSLRYATTAAFVAASYAEGGKCSADKAEKYMAFCEKQVNYALGSTGRSFVVGYGENAPEHPHHRTAQGSWCDNMNEPSEHRHTLYGALVGGPDASDGYEDTVSDYNKNEVACDYNAGFTGALAKMYKKYGGQTLINFGAVEKPEEEFSTGCSVNASGDGFTEIKAIVYNKTGWPARVCNDLELRYFVDLSELSDPKAVEISMNYGEGAKSGGMHEWDKKKGIYYVSIEFSEIYPGGQSAYKKEVQFRMSAPGWNPENDPSYADIGGSGSEVITTAVCLYDGGKLVYGKEPDGKISASTAEETESPAESTAETVSQSSSAAESSSVPSGNTVAGNGKISVTLGGQQGGSGNTVQVNLEIKNNSGGEIDISKLEVEYFFTADGGGELKFWCDHAALTGSGYTAVTDGVSGSFENFSGDKCDTKCAVKFGGGTLINGDSLVLQGRITKSDWSNFNLSDDYSSAGAEHICILMNGSEIWGSRP